jgi:energy-coupling factor transport system permease protein
MMQQSAVQKTSWLYRLDPRVKLSFVILAIGLLLVAPQIPLLIGILLGIHLLMLWGGVPLRELLSIWKALAPVVIFVLIVQPLLRPGDGVVIGQIGPIRLTESGLITGLRYALRITAAAFAVMVLIASTPVNRLVRGLEKLGLPYPLGMTIGLAVHYMGTLGDLYSTIAEAQQARGWDLSEGGLFKRARAAVPTLIAIIIASLRLSDALAIGLAARGFGIDHPRTHRHDIAMTRLDWVTLALLLAGFAALYIQSIRL